MPSPFLHLRNRLFYLIKPVIPRSLQISIRRWLVKKKLPKVQAVWPIDERAGTPPPGWKGWPQGKKFAFALMHDVDTAKGVENCRRLMELEEKLGFRSCFNFVPEDYYNPPELREELLEKGFSVGVHGLKHDGLLFSSRRRFLRSAPKINQYFQKWGAKGFSSPSMHHKLEWMHDLNIEYDISTFDTDPFEPQADGVRTIFPFVVQNRQTGHSYVEIPYTLPQDFTLFVLKKDTSIEIWKSKLRWIAEKGGLALVNTHPDYMHFGDTSPGAEEYPSFWYEKYLQFALDGYSSVLWHALPRDVATYCRSFSQ